MKRNCDLELGDSCPSDRQCHPLLDMKNSGNNQLLTLFCNGKVAVFDVTELQARAIILLANKEMEGTKPSLDSLLLPFLQSPLNSLSMKKSLQRYLQKRKTRIQATSPYHHHL
ncbi:TIFY 5A-like [Olea europaea subsp. europaea]|uniref:Protein TIFY n=2 Tax=Olea europaea subsp. europaea TaxID=158383 RepID=A0A8S0RUG6_OLEEU|nr:TIFY 5A-like [Olea europaea subsp. europaea]